MSLPKYHRVKDGDYFKVTKPLFKGGCNRLPMGTILQVIRRKFDNKNVFVMNVYSGKVEEGFIKRQVLNQTCSIPTKDEIMVGIL